MSKPDKSKPLTRASRRYRPSYLANAAVNPRDRPGSRRRLPPGLPVWLTLPHRAERDSHPLSCQCIADGSCTDLRDRLTSIRTIHGPLPPFKRLWPEYRWTVGPCDLSPTKVSHTGSAKQLRHESNRIALVHTYQHRLSCQSGYTSGYNVMQPIVISRINESSVTIPVRDYVRVHML